MTIDGCISLAVCQIYPVYIVIFINDGDASLSMTQHVLSLVSTHFKNRICWSQLVKQYQGFASGLKKFTHP